MIQHSAKCSRPVPVRRLSWAGQPELWCPSCGRYATVPVVGDTAADAATPDLGIPADLNLTRPVRRPRSPRSPHNHPNTAHKEQQA